MKETQNFSHDTACYVPNNYKARPAGLSCLMNQLNINCPMKRNGLLDLISFWNTMPHALFEYLRITIREKGGRPETWCSQVLVLLLSL